MRGSGVDLCWPLESLGSSGVAGFTQVSPWVVGFTRFGPEGRCVRPGSLGSLGFTLGVASVVGFTRVRRGVRWVPIWSLVSLGIALVMVRFIQGR